jgi:hypothetical protein
MNGDMLGSVWTSDCSKNVYYSRAGIDSEDSICSIPSEIQVIVKTIAIISVSH